jgi:hypothetical protein
MKKYRLLLIPFLAFELSWQAQAAESGSPYAEMDRLITAGQFEQAMNLGARNLEEWEGDPEFDFVYGLGGTGRGQPE